MNPLEQKQILLPTMPVKAVEVEKVSHGVAEERLIQQQCSQFSEEKMMEVAHGFKGTLQEW